MTIPVYREPLDVMARSIYAHYRNTGWSEMLAAAQEVAGTSRREKRDIVSICMGKFSCWKQGSEFERIAQSATYDTDGRFQQALAASTIAVFEMEHG